MVYIIDTYDRFSGWDKRHSCYRFTIHDIEYAVKEVKMEWGLPQLPPKIEETPPSLYYIYNTLEEALQYVQLIRKLN